MSIPEQIRALEELAAMDARLKLLEDEISQERTALETLKRNLEAVEEKLHIGRANLIATDKARSELLIEVRSMNQQLDHSRDKLGRARNEREANAAQRELEELRKLLRDREEELAKLTTSGDTARREIESTEHEAVQMAAELADREGDIKSRLTLTEQSRDEKLAAREGAVKALPPTLYRRYEVVRSKRNGAIAQTTDGTCKACFMSLPPQLFHRLRENPCLSSARPVTVLSTSFLRLLRNRDAAHMKSCPNCQRTFTDDARYCPVDGIALSSTSLAPIHSAADPRLGSALGNRYEIRRIVADGGMGRVYEAIDKQTDTRVAVKVLHDDVARDEVALARFMREYEISSQLPHDHIVKVLDFQREPSLDGAWFLVMEFLEGEELRFALKREKTIAPERLIRLLSQVALGLDEAHSRQFVHRDLKPDNIFLCGTREGDKVKLLDFGSVKDKNKDARKLTQLGTTIGSPFYMAPEQAQGLETLDARADIFALAAITYECVTGSVPFEGTNGPSILLSILSKDPIPPSIKGRDLAIPPPATMDDVIEEGLAKNPALRPHTVGAFADAVGRAYGLSGDHRAWAVVPQEELRRQCVQARPNVVPRPLDSENGEVDPFAQTDTRTLPSAYRPDHIIQRSTSSSGPPNSIRMGAPSRRPAWVIPALAGVGALIVAAAVMAFLMLSN